MRKKIYEVLGVMSGTSLDGIDLAWVRFQEENEQWRMQIIKAETLAYPENWRIALENAASLSTSEIETLDKTYTTYLGEVITDFIQRKKVGPLDAVCSHGHTVLHQPQSNLTWQIGNLPLLAKQIQQRVICDFRGQDVALGGQGAPLVPIGDQLLFGEYDFCLNLGGFANISSEKNKKRIAYDITAVNTVLNYLMKEVGKAYDNEGELAASGKVNSALLKKLDALAFYKKDTPKSLGIEWVKEKIFPLLQASGETIPNKLATYSEHIASQIAANLSSEKKKTCLITGGGAFNTNLIKTMAAKTNTTLRLPSADLINYKEAVVFGLLGVLKLRNQINVLKSVTGATQDHVSGKVYFYGKSPK